MSTSSYETLRVSTLYRDSIVIVPSTLIPSPKLRNYMEMFMPESDWLLSHYSIPNSKFPPISAL